MRREEVRVTSPDGTVEVGYRLIPESAADRQEIERMVAAGEIDPPAPPGRPLPAWFMAARARRAGSA